VYFVLFYVCDLSYFYVVLCPSSRQILVTPMNSFATPATDSITSQTNCNAMRFCSFCQCQTCINKQRCSNNKRINFISNRIVNLWNNLPSSTTNFTSFHKFDNSLNYDYLLLYCKLNFTQFVNCFFRRMIF